MSFIEVARPHDQMPLRSLPSANISFGSGHCTWFSADVERIYLASDSIKKIALKRGKMLENKMVMTGLPIRRDFALQADALGDRTSREGKEYQTKIREELGINKEKKMVLVMGGGEGEYM